jgi:hypothetical protein
MKTGKTFGFKRRFTAVFPAAALLLAALVSCASQAADAEAPAYSENSVTLDEAIARIAAYFIERLPEGSMTAIVSVGAEAEALADYAFEEVWNRFEESGKFTMIDRRNLERIRTEMNYQLSGEVSDESARSIGKQYGPQTIVYGEISPMGKEYRLVMYATDVETASGSQRALTVRLDSRLMSLLDATLDEKIERAVASMARALDRKTTIAVGRIVYGDTQTVSGFSAYLKNSITAKALKQQDKFLVADDSESADFAVSTRGLTVETPAADGSIQAVVAGNFSPLDDNAEVTIRLVSTSGNKAVLAAAAFVVPAAELSRRRLSLLPEKDSAVISKAEFESKQKAFDPYAGKNNLFTFTVSPDDLDGVYYDGELMSMRIYSEKDCWFRIVHVDVNGTAQVIYPAAARDNNFIRAGETRAIPDNTRFRMGPPFGEEYILAAAYDSPFSSRSDTGGHVSDSMITRGLSVETEDSRTTMSPAATAKFSYTILPKNSP